MHHLVRVLCALTLATGLSVIDVAARQQPAPPQPPVRTGVILGRVVDASTGQPIPKAIVWINGTPLVPGAFTDLPAAASFAITNGRGQFVFRDLPAGRFSFYVQAAGYLPGNYGQRRPDGSSRTVSLRDSESTTDAEVRLWKAAAINGTVFDESGPAVQITVNAFRRTMVRGRMQLAPVASAISDERGIYRLHSLVPGDYLVAMTTNITSIPVSASEAYWKAAEAVQPGGAIDMSQRRMMSELSAAQTMSAMGGVTVRNQQVYTWYNRPIAPSPGTEDRFLIYPTTFHPAASSSRAATVVTVGSGDDRQGVDLQIAMAQTFAVSGTVAGPDGPMPNVPVRLVPAYAEDFGADNILSASATSTDGEGRFTLVGVPPGDYAVSAARAPINAGGPVMMANGTMIMTSPGSPAPPAIPGSDVTLWAESSVNVADKDVGGVALTMQPGFKISGRLEFEGATKPQPNQMAGFRFALSRPDGRSVPSAPSAAPSQAGSFATGQYPPGSYTITIASRFGGGFLKSITVGGREVLGRSIDLTRDLDGVVMTFTDRAPTVSGTARRSGSETDVKAAVAIFPAAFDDWIAGGMSGIRARLVDAAPNGSFEVGSLPPGDYMVAAIDAATPVELQDPKDIAALARIATRISLADGEQKVVPLTVVRVR